MVAAALLPNGKQQFFSANGVPLASGFVYMYIPATTTFKNTWQDANKSVLNTNPIVLDAAGEAIIYGDGQYRQIVKDASGNLIWDQLTTTTRVSDSTDLAFTPGTIAASAPTTDLSGSSATIINITGDGVTIQSFGSSCPIGSIKNLIFGGSVTLKNSSSLINPGKQDVVTSAGDAYTFECTASGVWQCAGYALAKTTGVSVPGTPQTVLIGAVDSNGYANFITTGSGLRAGLLATTSNVVINFAAGITAQGVINYVEALTADSTTFFPLMTANNLYYLYAERVGLASVIGGATLAPVQYGYTYNRTAQSCLKLQQNVLDDFGNSWVGTNITYSNTLPAITNTYMAVFNGASSKIVSTDFTSLGGNGWTLRGKVKTGSSVAGTYGIFNGVNGSSFGADLRISASKLQWYLSSTGAANDIVNGTSGATSLSTSTLYDLEFCFDAVAGKYFVYLNGAQELTVTSSSKICAITSLNLGWAGGANWFNGSIEGFEFLPYCLHPNGTSFTPPATLPDIIKDGYSSDWFDIPNMKMKKVSAVSVVGGVNPTFTDVTRVYVGEATTGGAAVSSVVSYAFQGRYIGSWVTPTPTGATLLTANHNVGMSEVSAKIQLKNLTAELGYVPGDILDATVGIFDGANPGSPPICVTRNTVTATNGASATFRIFGKTSGNLAASTAANWAYRLVAERRI